MVDKTERIMIFIDGSNLYHSLKSHFKRTDIDIGKFCNKLLDKRRLIRIYYYNAVVGRREEPDRYRDQQAFFAKGGDVFVCGGSAYAERLGQFPNRC